MAIVMKKSSTPPAPAAPIKKTAAAAPVKEAPAKKEKVSKEKPRSPKEIALLMLVEQHALFIASVEAGDHTDAIVSLSGRGNVREKEKLLAQTLAQLKSRSERMLLPATKLLSKRGLA